MLKLGMKTARVWEFGWLFWGIQKKADSKWGRVEPHISPATAATTSQVSDSVFNHHLNLLQPSIPTI